jgi:hypothetical protein
MSKNLPVSNAAAKRRLSPTATAIIRVPESVEHVMSPIRSLDPAIAIAVLSLVLSVTTFVYQRFDVNRVREERRRTEPEQIRARVLAGDSARTAYGVAMVLALGSTALSGEELQKSRALQALTVAAPTYAADLAGVAWSTATSAKERELARQMNLKASVDELDARFLRHVQLARELRQKEFFAEACAEFSLAFKALSDRLYGEIDRGMTKAATSACEAGRVEGGSADFLKAVRRIMTN